MLYVNLTGDLIFVSFFWFWVYVKKTLHYKMYCFIILHDIDPKCLPENNVLISLTPPTVACCILYAFLTHCYVMFSLFKLLRMCVNGENNRIECVIMCDRVNG